MTVSRPFVLTDEERRRALRVGELAARGHGALPELVALLEDPSWAVRRAVVAALSSMGRPATLALCDILRNRRDHETRLAATVEALVASKDDVDSIVATLLDAAAPPVVCDGAQILGRRRASSAVPRLAALTTSTDDNVALAAIEALGRIGDDAALTPLIAAVEERNFFRTFPAIDVLGRSGNSRALKPLVGILGDARYSVEAARALGRIGDAAAVPALTQLLLKPAAGVVRAASSAVVEILDRRAERFGGGLALENPLGEDETRTATQRVVQAMPHADPGEQTALVRALSWLGGENAAVALVDLVQADNSASKAAGNALGRLGRAAQPYLLQALASADSERRLVLLPLLSHGSDNAETVARCLTDPNPTVRALACDALARIGAPEYAPQVFALLADPDPRVSQGAVATIQSLGSRESERLALQAAESKDARVRRAGLRIIAYFGYASALDVLVAAMADPDERIRDAAIFGLPFLDDRKAVDALLGAAVHASAKTRAAAMRALGQAPTGPRTVLALRVGLHDADSWVRYFACQALSRLKDTESADLIGRLIGDPAGQVRVAVIEALAQLRGVNALDVLHKAATERDADVRRAALLGLGQVKDASSLPVLREALTSDDAATRLVAVSAIAQFDLSSVAADLGSTLTDGDDAVRGAAIALLASRSGPEATRELVVHIGTASIQERIVAALAQTVQGRIEVLADALKTASRETAPALVSALMRMRRADATRVLEDAFANEDAIVRRAVAPALAVAGTTAARSLLARAADEDPDPEVREVARAAAGSTER